MFADGGAVSLGVVSRSPLARQDWIDDAYASRTGGEPVWLGTPPPEFAPSGEGVRCAVCGQPLLLLVQLYAPVEHPRSICVFGCNRQKCENQPGTWRVFRSQLLSTAPAPQAAATPPAPPSAGAVSLSPTDDCAGWGEDAGDDSPLDDEIEALLRDRDEIGLPWEQPLPPPVIRPSRSNLSAIPPASRPHLPTFQIDVMEEPTWGVGRDATGVAAAPEGEWGDDEEDCDEDEDGLSSTLTNEAIKLKLERYLRQEDDVALRERIAEATAIASTTACVIPQGGDDELASERFESLPEATRMMLRFQVSPPLSTLIVSAAYDITGTHPALPETRRALRIRGFATLVVGFATELYTGPVPVRRCARFRVPAHAVAAVHARRPSLGSIV